MTEQTSNMLLTAHPHLTPFVRVLCPFHRRTLPKRFTVMAVSVLHIPGSCMFVFWLGNKVAVYTGDFVYTDAWASAVRPMLPSPVDILAYDNTFAKHGPFPPIPESARMLLELIDRARNDKQVVMFDRAWGAFPLLAAAQRLRPSLRVRLSPVLLTKPEYGARHQGKKTSPTRTCDILLAHVSELERHKDAMCIQSSMIWFTCQRLPFQAKQDNRGVWRIPLMTHCDRSGIQALVKWLKPKKQVTCAVLQDSVCPYDPT